MDMTSYQKLKKKLEQSEKAKIECLLDIQELVNNPNSFKSNLIKARAKFIKNIEYTLWFGNNSSGYDKHITSGIGLYIEDFIPKPSIYEL